jgi:hypothetical protein
MKNLLMILEIFDYCTANYNMPTWFHITAYNKSWIHQITPKIILFIRAHTEVQILPGTELCTSTRTLYYLATYITLQSGHSALCQEMQCSSLFQRAVWQYPHTSVQSTVVNTRFLNLMFCSLYIVVCQYSRTNKMHLVFSLLWTNSLYMFRALLDHLQEVLHKQLVYCMCIM